MTQPERDYWPTQDWRTAVPEEHGMDGTMLANIRDVGARTEPPATGVLVVRRGYMLCEEYFNGAGPSMYNPINSATKSVTSALIGIARRDGLLGDLDEPVASFFPEIALDDERKRRISLRHLLTMTSGFVDVDRSDLERVLRADDPVRFIWQRPMACEPGRHFSYDDAALQLLSIILSRVTGTSAAEYAKRELFEPLGIWPDTAQAGWRIPAPPAGSVPPFGASWPPTGLR